MEVLFKIVAVALVTVLACLIVKPVRADFAIIISIVGGLIVVFYILDYLGEVFDVFNQIFSLSGLSSSVYATVFKIVGVGYLIEFTASICNDTGNHSLADRVILGGKIVILVMALPIVTSILDIVMELLPT